MSRYSNINCLWHRNQIYVKQIWCWSFNSSLFYSWTKHILCTSWLHITFIVYVCFIFVKSKHFPKDQSAANLSLLHLSRLFRASLQKVLSFKIPQKDIGWTRKVTMNFSYIFYGISSHKKSFLTAFYLIFILDFFISRGGRKFLQIKTNIFY